MPTPRLLDQVRSALRVRHDSLRTGEAWLQWIKRYIFFHGKRHPGGMGEPEITAFLVLYIEGKNKISISIYPLRETEAMMLYDLPPPYALPFCL